MQHPSPPEFDDWIAQARQGEISWQQLAENLLAATDGSQARKHRPDHDRARRCGFGEVIFGEGKSAADICHIATELLEAGQSEVLVTRVPAEAAQTISGKFAHTRYSEDGRTLRIGSVPIPQVAKTQDVNQPAARVAVVTAGSTDRPVASEALETLLWMGVDAELICDVGVAGPYRLLAHLETLRECAAIVVVAGMEGALASVMGGLVPCPVIAVPTSVGYGANLQGITTLLSMLSSCAAGVTVVNVDAGFKGGYNAGLIAHQVHAHSSPVAQR